MTSIKDGVRNSYVKWKESWRRYRLRIDDSSIKIGERVKVKNYRKLAISRNARLHDDVMVMGKVSIGKHTQIRNHSILNAEGGEISIGEHCSVNEFCVFNGMGGITIGDDVRIATHTCIFSTNHIFEETEKKIREQGVALDKVTIGNDVWIGAGVKILAGVSIGDGVVIGAGSVVNHSIPSYSVAVGVPARVVSKRLESEISILAR